MDKMYFILEWKNDDIIRCQRVHNCGMAPETETFSQALKMRMMKYERMIQNKGKAE